MSWVAECMSYSIYMLYMYKAKNPEDHIRLWRYKHIYMLAGVKKKKLSAARHKSREPAMAQAHKALRRGAVI